MSTSTSRSTSLIVGLASVGPLALALFGLLLGLGLRPVIEWFWPTPTTNVAEAAVLGDAARIRQLAAQGASLDMPQPVREDLRGGGASALMSPLEAAIRHQAESIPELLVELGVRPSSEEAVRLFCLARNEAATQAADLLRDTFRVRPESCAVAATAER